MVSFPFYKYIEAISIIYPQNKDVAYLHFISKGVQSNPYKTTILGTTQTLWATFDSEHTFIKKHDCFTVALVPLASRSYQSEQGRGLTTKEKMSSSWQTMACYYKLCEQNCIANIIKKVHSTQLSTCNL